MRVLAEIPSRSSADLRTGTLRRSDMNAFDGLLTELGGVPSVLIAGEAPGRRQVSVGLAAAAAASGSRTALLECDLAEPGLADSLGLAHAPGLHEHLLDGVGAEAILKPVALAGPGSARATEPLVCVVAGRPSSEGPALFASDAFARALSGLRDAYDLLVLDGLSLAAWGSLGLLVSRADRTIACLGPADPRDLPVPVSGLVIQN